MLTGMEHDETFPVLQNTSINTLKTIKCGKIVSFAQYMTVPQIAANTGVATLANKADSISNYQYVCAINSANGYSYALRVTNIDGQGKLFTHDYPMPAGTYIITGSYITG